MAKSLKTLVNDIYGLFTSEFKPTEEDVKSFGHLLAQRISDRIGEERGVPGLRLSNLGTPCERKLWYSVNTPGDAEPLPPEARFKFLFGDVIESLIIWLARQAGHKVEDEQKEVKLHGVVGHMDATIDGVLVDVKSASSFSFNKFQGGLTPDMDAFGYLTQLDSYQHSDARDRGAFIAVDKTLGKICIDEHQRTNTDYQPIIEAKRKMLSDKRPPSRGFPNEPDGKSGNYKLGVNCSYCEFKKKCWPGVRTFIYSTGPRYLTRVERTPDVPEVF